MPPFFQLLSSVLLVTCVNSAPVQVNAFRALGAMCPTVPPQQLQPHLQPLLGALVHLLKAADEESLHLVLEVLEALILAAGRAPEGLAPDQAMAVAQPVLQVRQRAQQAYQGG